MNFILSSFYLNFPTPRYGAKIIVAGEIPPGTVFVVFFSVMTGSFSLGNMAPLIGVLAVAKGAGASILSIIDSVNFTLCYNKFI